jgi:hypothetical protein
MSDVIKYERTEQGVRIVPVYTEQSAPYFVDPDKYPLWNPIWEVEVDGQRVKTGLMKIGALYDLLAISQTQSLLEAGVIDMTDAIGPNVALESIWIEAKSPDGTSRVTYYPLVGEDNADMPTAAFSNARNYRQMELNFATNSLVSFDGQSRLDLHVAGTINLELGHCEVVASGVVASPDQGVEYEVIGYTLRAFRENHNRLHRAQNERRQAVLNEIADERIAQKEAEQEERAFVPQISVFSGAPHPGDDYFRKGMVISSHEVEGAASNLKIVVGDEPAVPGNGNHRYDILGFDTASNASEYEGSFARALSVLFQNGPIPSHGNNGVTIEALLAVIAHRLEGFQTGPFASQDNEDALFHTLQAMEALQRRTRNRIARQVEGTYQA